MDWKQIVKTAGFAAALLGSTAIAEANKPLAPGVKQDPEAAEFRGVLDAHNQWRRRAGVQDLSWSDTAAQQAGAWAGQLAREGCKLRFSPDEFRKEYYGQNLFYAFSSRPYEGYSRTLQQVIDRWGSEGQNYDWATGTCRAPLGKSCGQYTQLVWGETQYVGCARARCETAEVWVCNYTPRGNVEGLKPAGNATAQPVMQQKPVQACFAADGYVDP